MNRIDEVSLSILFELSKAPLHFNELARRMRGKCSRKALQRRLNELVKAGILEVKKDGQYKFYAITDKRLSTGLKLLNQLSTTMETVLSSNVPDPILKNEMIIIYTLMDMAWYYVWFNFMVNKDIGEILLLAFTKECWPGMFKLLESFLSSKGIDVKEMPANYISELLTWINDLKNQIMMRQDIVHKNEIGEVLTCFLEAYRSLTTSRPTK